LQKQKHRAPFLQHLSSSKSSPDFAKRLLDDVIIRLERTGYTVMQTPFGYFHEFQDACFARRFPAKVFKEFSPLGISYHVRVKTGYHDVMGAYAGLKG